MIQPGRQAADYLAALFLLAGICSSARWNCALAAPPEKQPHTAPAQHRNRLAGETSPYLLLHAHNPVDWYPWGDEALAKAKRENKLIFLSIGYSSCYWCHVMERESFSDQAIADVLNKFFVCIKVDREERPDIDEIYMRALEVYLQLAGSPQGGGWPLSMFLTSDGKPLAGGTYFPPRDKEGLTGFLTVVERIHAAYEKEPAKYQKTADRLTEIVADSLRQRPALLPVPLDDKLISEVQRGLAEQYDEQHGGFGFSAENPRKPKFPEPPNLVFLLSRARGGNEPAKKMLLSTLEHLAAGGIRDHVGGGFHRYSTDRYWQVPHFEKMLYDNGQLTSVYTRAYELEPRPEFKRVVVETLAFVQRELTSPEGGFYAAIDAETDGHEGSYYVWSRAEIEQALTPDEFARFARVYGVDKEPNFEASYVLQLAAEKQPSSELLDGLAGPRAKLLQVRERRKRPLTDKKILTAWNGLMIRGYADAARVFKVQAHGDAARRAAEFVLQKLRDPQGRRLRVYVAGKARLPGFLDDYAFFVDGLIALAEATGEKRWLDEADRLVREQLELFWDHRAGGFFFTSNAHEQLIARSKVYTDGVTPSGNSVSAANLIYLGRKLNRPEYLQRAEQTLQAAAAVMQQFPIAAPQAAAAIIELEKTGPRGKELDAKAKD